MRSNAQRDVHMHQATQTSVDERRVSTKRKKEIGER